MWSPEERRTGKLGTSWLGSCQRPRSEIRSCAPSAQLASTRTLNRYREKSRRGMVSGPSGPSSRTASMGVSRQARSITKDQTTETGLDAQRTADPMPRLSTSVWPVSRSCARRRGRLVGISGLFADTIEVLDSRS